MAAGGGGEAGVRRAAAGDVPALAAMLARAFADDPIARWSCPRDDLRPGILEHFHRTRARQLIRDGEAWMSADGASAALWANPEHPLTSLRDDLEIASSMVHPRFWRRAPLVGYGLIRLEGFHPSAPPHWYLAVLGTDPDAQGRGLGSAVLAPVLEECDRDGVAAYLVSSKERNIDFYARFGFRVTREIRLPRGPRAWAMWRDAA
jgi:ribosomal protein S18 acetylase RimI-like enzyme